MSESLTFLNDLTASQREAVTHGEGPLLVLAGPGSGKTRVITYRIAYLLASGVSRGQILALTFTNKAADEIGERVHALTGQSGVWIGTFHKFCARLLRKHAQLVGLSPNFSIYDETEAERLLRRAAERLGIPAGSVPFRALGEAIHWAKNHLVLPEDYIPRTSELPAGTARRLYAAYQEELRRCNAVDFDDLLLLVARILGEHPDLRAELDERFRFILVDEYQDTNLAQYAIARALSIDYPNLTVTGDPDQSIYRWRGATIRNILEFEKDYPYVKVIRLEENYRSTQRILRVADALIAHNSRRIPKRLFTRGPEGKPVRLVIFRSEEQEAQEIAAEISGAVQAGRAYRDFAIFFRINALTRTWENALRERRIPYQVVNGTEFFQRKEIQDVVAHLRLLANPRDDEAFVRVLHCLPRGIGGRTLQRVVEFARIAGLSLAESLEVPELWQGMSRRTAEPLREFAGMLARLWEISYHSIAELVEKVLEVSGYLQALQAKGPAGRERLANVEEFLSAARQFDARRLGPADLPAFLEQVALVADTDRYEDRGNHVSLLTLHAAKGLEFPVVYIVAVEQGLLPYEDTWRDPEELEEERRLFFVGITRAKEELHLTRSVYREFRGQKRMTIPSAFLLELPRTELHIEDRSEEQVGFVLQNLEGNSRSGIGGAAGPETDSGGKDAGDSRAGGVRLGVGSDLVCGFNGPSEAEPPPVGALVLDPDRGLGRVVLCGKDPAGSWAIVEFPPPEGRVKINLAESRIRVIRRSGERLTGSEHPGGKDQ